MCLQVFPERYLSVIREFCKRINGILPSILLSFVLILGCRESIEIAEKQRLTLAPLPARYMLEAEKAFSRGVYGLALAYTDSAEAHAPSLADLHFLRGKIYTQLNRLEVAQAAYQVVLEIDPKYPGARFEMGLNSFRASKFRDAVSYYRKEESEVGPVVALYHELGRAYARLGEQDSARIAYETAIAMDPEHTTTYMWLGQLLEDTGDLESALKMSLKGLGQRPDDLDYQYVVGTQYLRLDSVDAAMSNLENVAKAWPWHHGAHFNLGQAYLRLGLEKEADTYFLKAEEAQQRDQNINKAQNAVNTDPSSPANWIELGDQLRESKRYARAIEAYKNGLAINLPPNLALYMQTNLATLYMECGEFTEAVRRFQAILRTDPDLSTARLNLGIAYAQSGELEEAHAVWTKLLEREPEHSTAQNYLKVLESMDQNGDVEASTADCRDLR